MQKITCSICKKLSKLQTQSLSPHTQETAEENLEIAHRNMP